ncbi:MAG: trypsin-like serine peptidase [Pikeienuella sp.]
MMRRGLLALAFLLVPVAAAQEGRVMLDVEAQERWSGVGRLNLGDAQCTAALVAPDLAVTAAHCVFAHRTGAARRPERVTFVAGYRQGRYKGYSRARRIVVHPDYVHTREPDADSVAADLALIWLETPIEDAAPFRIAPGLKRGDRVSTISYGRNRPEIASIEPECNVTARRGGVAALDCDVTFGVSGAPVFREVEGQQRIVAIVSSMEKSGPPRAYAVVLEEALPEVLSAR